MNRFLRLLPVMVILGSGGVTAAPAPARLDRERLLEFRAPDGSVRPVVTPADWAGRRREIVAGLEAIMGPLPGPAKRVPLAVRVIREDDGGSFVRREIIYTAEPGGDVPAFLLLPKEVRDGRRTAPGVLCLMPTNQAEGVLPVVGLGAPGGKPNRNYGEELAREGWVVLAPPYPHLHTYRPDLRGLGYASGTMKAIWDNVRALDVLAATPGVRTGGFAAIGHSLGGHNALFTAVFDERIRAVVTSCGFDSFLDYYGGQAKVWQPGQGWTQERYMPALARYAGRLGEIPFDFHEILAALAPRGVRVNAPTGDANFQWRSVDRVVAAARPVFRLLGAEERVVVEHPDSEHDFPPAQRQAAYRWLEEQLR